MVTPRAGVQTTAHRSAVRTVVVVDMVESVRLIEQNEEDTVGRWQAFVAEVTAQLLPKQRGRLVKSLGDGLMLEFEDVPAAIGCCHLMHQAMQSLNQGHQKPQWMQLRIGVHVADVIVDELDLYGTGVNLAARLAGVAGPFETVVSAEARDRLTAGLDAEIEDLGDCYLKHFPHAVRAYRVDKPSGFSPPKRSKG